MYLFVEVTNITKDNIVWAQFTVTGYYPSALQLSRQIPKERVRIETCCLCFKTIHVDWDDTKVTGISGIEVTIPTSANVSIFTDNDLTNINDDHFEINLMAHLLNQINIVPLLPPRYDYYNDPPEGGIEQAITSTLTGAIATAPLLSFTVQ